MNLFSKIFGTQAKDIVDAVGNVLDGVITNKEELAQAKLEAAKELNRHLEAMSEQIVKQQELEVKDRETARVREAEIVKATGHFDWMMWGLAAAGIGMLFYALYQLVNSHIENKELFTHFVGIIEGVVVSIYSYYFGSSLGSRIKDMK
jgi:hypothetical protein